MSLLFLLFLIRYHLILINFLYQAHESANDVKVVQPSEQQLLVSIVVTLIPVVLAFTFIIFLFYRHKRETHFREVQLVHRLDKAELEMKALRSQVNPHFIFNCLNSIQHFIHKNESRLAETYLTKFSRLIRLVLENSTNAMVPISDDVQALDLYIQMEQLRLNNSFEYEIDIKNIDADNLYIPPLLIQPFVENSIWHGLANKPNNGKVLIEISMQGQLLNCKIEDNGVAKASGKHKDIAKSKSMGLDLIQQRLNLFGRKHNAEYHFDIKDKIGEQGDYIGKSIELILPFED